MVNVEFIFVLGRRVTSHDSSHSFSLTQDIKLFIYYTGYLLIIPTDNDACFNGYLYLLDPLFYSYCGYTLWVIN